MPSVQGEAAALLLQSGGIYLLHGHWFLIKRRWRTRRIRAVTGAEARLLLGSLPAIASAPWRTKSAAAESRKEQSATFTHQEMPVLYSLVRKHVWHSNQICFIKKLAIKFLGIHHLNFESCNILLVHNNTVSLIYIIILYITKIAMLYYWIMLPNISLNISVLPPAESLSMLFSIYSI